ncbi:unnamed protein product, partial [Pylaiella littoralis]
VGVYVHACCVCVVMEADDERGQSRGSGRTRLIPQPGRGFMCSACRWRFSSLRDGRAHISTCKGGEPAPSEPIAPAASDAARSSVGGQGLGASDDPGGEAIEDGASGMYDDGNASDGADDSPADRTKNTK